MLFGESYGPRTKRGPLFMLKQFLNLPHSFASILRRIRCCAYLQRQTMVRAVLFLRVPETRRRVLLVLGHQMLCMTTPEAAMLAEGPATVWRTDPALTVTWNATGPAQSGARSFLPRRAQRPSYVRGDEHSERCAAFDVYQASVWFLLQSKITRVPSWVRRKAELEFFNNINSLEPFFESLLRTIRPKHRATHQNISRRFGHVFKSLVVITAIKSQTYSCH